MDRNMRQSALRTLPFFKSGADTESCSSRGSFLTFVLIVVAKYTCHCLASIFTDIIYYCFYYFLIYVKISMNDDKHYYYLYYTICVTISVSDDKQYYIS